MRSLLAKEHRSRSLPTSRLRPLPRVVPPGSCRGFRRDRDRSGEASVPVRPSGRGVSPVTYATCTRRGSASEHQLQSISLGPFPLVAGRSWTTVHGRANQSILRNLNHSARPISQLHCTRSTGISRDAGDATHQHLRIRRQIDPRIKRRLTPEGASRRYGAEVRRRARAWRAGPSGSARSRTRPSRRP